MTYRDLDIENGEKQPNNLGLCSKIWNNYCVMNILMFIVFTAGIALLIMITNARIDEDNERYACCKKVLNDFYDIVDQLIDDSVINNISTTTLEHLINEDTDAIPLALRLDAKACYEYYW